MYDKYDDFDIDLENISCLNGDVPVLSLTGIKVTIYHKLIGYNTNVMKQSACLVVNPLFAPLFECKPLGRVSDAVMESK